MSLLSRASSARHLLSLTSLHSLSAIPLKKCIYDDDRHHHFSRHHCRFYSSPSSLHSPASSHYRQMDVTKHNFADAHALFLRHLSSASFLSFDFEFTGLELSYSDRSVYNESLDARYEKLRKAVQRFVPLQMGICLWEKKGGNASLETTDAGAKESDEPAIDAMNPIDAVKQGSSAYVARSFNFNIFPQYSKVFLVETSALQFLIENQFDFNKVIRDGVPFMNEVECAKQRQGIEAYGKASLQKYTLDKTHSAYQVVQGYLEEVQRFRNTATLGQTRVLTVERSFHLKLLEQEILRRFPDVFPVMDKTRECVVLHFVDESIKERIIHEEKEKKLARLEHRNGLTRIINSIIESRTPIVCHNGMYDLLYLYHHFIRPLPLVCSDFKSQLHEAFPTIFDTKYIVCNSGEVKKLLGHDTRPETMNLGSLYQYATNNLDTHKGVSVQIPHKFGNCADREVAHEAGYDAFMTGTVMLRFMNHVCKSPYELEKGLKEHSLGNRIAVSNAEYCVAL
uniref:Uncharacterized protein n=1 Tax=Percolomonas cosmopolitus TaxID=63605 RepID=A0A7S1KML8_9EUKA